MPLDSRVHESLKRLGVKPGDEQESSLLGLLRVVLKTCKSPPKPLSLTEIFEAMKKEKPKKEFTKTWVRRTLNQLIDMQLVQIENEVAYRKQYITDVNIIMGGLEELKSRITSKTKQEISDLHEELERISEIQCAILAQELVKGLTGKSQLITSRIVKDLDEFQRVLKYNIHDISKKGDVIRATMGWIQPFMKGDRVERTQKFFEAARRGVDVRYLITGDVMQVAPSKGLDMDDTISMLQTISELHEQKLKFDVRIYKGPPNYTFISLNNENMLLVVSKDPLRATWTTRSFNPDLIDNAIDSFDKHWADSFSLLELSMEDMISMGAQQDGLIPKALHEVKTDTTDDEK